MTKENKIMAIEIKNYVNAEYLERYILNIEDAIYCMNEIAEKACHCIDADSEDLYSMCFIANLVNVEKNHYIFEVTFEDENKVREIEMKIITITVI